MRTSIRPSVRFRTLERFGFKCHYCGVGAKEAILEVDHIVPVAKGGTNAETNLVVACRDCNQGKSDMMLRECPPVPGVCTTEVSTIIPMDLSILRSHKVWEAEEQLGENILSFAMALRPF